MLTWKRCTLIFLVIILFGCRSIGEPRPSNGCDSGLEYQGRMYNGQAIWNFLGIDATVKTQAVREVSDLMQIYLHESANLCDLYASKGISNEAYMSRRSELAERFGEFASLNQEMPAQEIGDEEAGLYIETLQRFHPDVAPHQLQARVVAMSNGRILRSHDVMYTGDGFHLEVSVSGSAYLYAVLVDSDKQVSRLYPTRLTGGMNPVSGTIIIPSDGSRELALIGNPGEERILIFLQDRPSPMLENTLKEIDETDSQTEKVDRMRPPRYLPILTRGIAVRSKLTDRVGPVNNDLIGRFGQVATEFIIDHRSPNIAPEPSEQIMQNPENPKPRIIFGEEL